jgi:hypothetical protein
MKTVEVLMRARKLIEIGHAKGYAALDRDGNSLGEWSSPDACAWCIVGALNVAAETADDETPEGAALRSAAFDALAPFVGTDFIGWNDAPERTQADVLAALDAAIASEAAQ